MEGYLGSIMLWAVPFEPAGWLFCNGQEIAIASYQALYHLIGNSYGIASKSDHFKLPDFKGRFAIGQSDTRKLGQTGGYEQIVLNANQIPSHKHNVTVDVKQRCDEKSGFFSNAPVNNYMSILTTKGSTVYSTSPNPSSYMGAPEVTINQNSVGSNEAHNNMPPYQVLNYIICVQGTYPTPNN